MNNLIIDLSIVAKNDQGFAETDLNARNVGSDVRKQTEFWQNIQENPRQDVRGITDQRLQFYNQELQTLLRSRAGSKNFGYGPFEVIKGPAIEYAVIAQISNLLRVWIDVNAILTKKMETVKGGYGTVTQPTSKLVQWMRESSNQYAIKSTPTGETDVHTLPNLYKTTVTISSGTVLSQDFRSAFAKITARKKRSLRVHTPQFSEGLPVPMLYSIDRGFKGNKSLPSTDYDVTYHPGAAAVIANRIGQSNKAMKELLTQKK